jgi:hypothetical protein
MTKKPHSSQSPKEVYDGYPSRVNPSGEIHITQKVRIDGQCTLYLSVHDDEQPAGIFLRVKGADCSSGLIGLYDVTARLMSLALQYGAPLEKVGDLLAGAKFAPCGSVSRHDRAKPCGRYTQGGMGAGSAHRPILASRASFSSLSSSIFAGAYFRYHQHQPCLTSSWIEIHAIR